MITVKGFNGDFPYENPDISFYRSNQNSNMFGIISDAGSLVCGSTSITFSFNKDYNQDERFTLEASTDKSSGTFYGDTESMYRLIEKLKKNSIAQITFYTDCSINTFKISLKGSTVALNKLVGNYYNDKMIPINANKEMQENWRIKAFEIMPKQLSEKSKMEVWDSILNLNMDLSEIEYIRSSTSSFGGVRIIIKINEEVITLKDEFIFNDLN